MNVMSNSCPESFLQHLPAVFTEIATHKRFASCEAAQPRRFGHLLLLWGFVGAAITSGLLFWALTPTFVEIGWLKDGEPFRKIAFLIALGMILGATVIDIALILWQAFQRLRGIDPDPANRHATAFDLLEELRDPAAVRRRSQVGAGARARRWRRDPRPLAAALLLLAALGGLGGIAWLAHRRGVEDGGGTAGKSEARGGAR